MQVKTCKTLHEKIPSETFYTPKIINFYNYNFSKNKYFAYACALKLHVFKALTGSGQVRKFFKAKLVQFNSDTHYNHL